MPYNDARIKDKIRGCLIGGAAGDALGYPVELMTEKQIKARFGEKGLTDYFIDFDSNRALVSDDTQMTLFTANGILYWETRGELKGIAASVDKYIAKSYTDWLWTQLYKYGEKEPDSSVSWLLSVPELYSKRAPGNACFAALLRRTSKDVPDSFISSPINDSKGCGGLVRVAPLGLDKRFIHEPAFSAAEVAAISHSHPLGYLSAAVFAQMINGIVFENMELPDAIQFGLRGAERHFGNNKYFKDLSIILNKAICLSGNQSSDSENFHVLGDGLFAEEVLSMSIYCALRYRDDFSNGIISAVNHGGYSGSIGAVTGSILGAILGYETIPDKWKRNLELSELILEIADDLERGCVLIDDYDCDDVWERKYVQCKRVGKPTCNGSLSKEERNAKHIRHTFKYCPLAPISEPEEKTVTIIHSDGLVEIKEYVGRKVTSRICKQVSKEEFSILVNKMETSEYEPSFICDAMSYASILYSDGKVRRFTQSPVCIDDFIERLKFNSTFVITVDI